MQIHSARTAGQRSWHSDRETEWLTCSLSNITVINCRMFNASTEQQQQQQHRN